MAEFGSARLWDDGVIKPEDTRKYLALALEASRGGVRQKEDTDFGIWRM